MRNEGNKFAVTMVAMTSSFSNQSANNGEQATLDEVLAGVVLEGDSDFALSDGCSSEGEGEGFSAYHRQPELDAEKVTALSSAVKFPTVGFSDGSSDCGEVFMASTDGEENRIVIQVSIIV